MTVSYQYDVASSASGGFIRLLFRWRGSVWKVVYREMLLFTVCYVLLTIMYQFALTESQQRIFEKIVFFCSTFMDLIPLSFMLGFYVSFIAARWWSQFTAIPWPDKLMNIVAMYIPGFDESSRVVRRTLMRYLNLSLVLVLRSISMAVKRRFPTKEHLIEAGFMTKTELEMFQSVPSTEFNTFWIPCTWFINVLREARQECRITDSNGLKLIMEELNEFRSKCGLLWGYDWISIPLVYTQVVTMATYAFFVACMFGRQNVNPGNVSGAPAVHRYDYYVPIFTILQLMFYMGLLKVAEQLINPFGDDDEDFELNWIIDRHMKVSYLGVDTLNGAPPPLVKDTYYNELDVKIPYTEASKSYKKKTYRGSVAYMQVPMEKQGMVLPDMSEEEDDGETPSENMGPRRPSVYTLFQSKGKGLSPASSYTNLDNRSTASLDSDWKSSLPNLSTLGAKNASGTLGNIQVPHFTVDMAKAENDEMVLQEVVVESKDIVKPTVKRSDSLQVPGTSDGVEDVKEPSTTFSILRGASPKIAPKFAREKLKSMFRKRRLPTAFPFYKVKGVHFSKDANKGDFESLLDISYQEPVEVEITLSTPELTEAEKETGVHPYYFTQQTMTAKQLVTGHAVTVRQPTLPRYGSEEDKKSKEQASGTPLVRSCSLPSIPQSEAYARYIHDPIIAASLKKIENILKSKERPRKGKRKKKSPPPRLEESTDQESPPCEMEPRADSDEESPSRRNTLPQITLTRCGQKASEHLDLATPAASSGHSSSHSSDNGKPGGPKKEKKEKPSHRGKPPSARNRQAHALESTEKTSPSSAPEPHSTAKKPRQSSPPPHLRPSDILRTPADVAPRRSQTRRRSPPPRPESLSLYYKPKPTKKIAGISLKSTKATTSPTSKGTPSSPVSSIPSASKDGHAPSFPKPSSSSPKCSPTTETPPVIVQVPTAQADTTIMISDSREDIYGMSDQKDSRTGSPPEPPQRHIPRSGAKSKK